MRQRLVFVGSLLVIVPACSPAIAPRTGDTTPAGELGWNVHAALWNVGRGHFEGGAAPDAPVSTGGADIYPGTETFPWFMSAALSVYDVGITYGVRRWFEVGASLGFQRMGGEARFAVLDEDHGDPVSLALGAGGYYSAIGNGPWGRAGLDLSLRWGRVAPLLNLYVSHGATYNSAYLDLPGNADCPREGPWQPCGRLLGVLAVETRWTGAVGVAFAVRKDGGKQGAITVGLVPHVVLHASERVRVLGEDRPEVLRHVAGLHLVLGGQGPGW